eukprot:Gregarina_sp_Poly_1__5721@NODE_3006_length_1457_cov_111_425899_g1903_i0_p1_GENE_NODE_3006_length_1457_cov_111_425899_g1903_i0NODE_3006_length_1457_cov_111_425899_g1903_i0_p1_ORF_typecomplete_len157_score13_09Rota_NS53/PF00981_17/0_15_NODE_3006_length_1457_cov_111_425899_g1903_i032502
MKVVSAAESSRHLNNILLKTETWSAILSVFRFAVFDTLSDLSEAYPDGFKILEYSREGHQVSNRGFTKSLVKFTRQNIKDVYIKSRHQQADGTVGWSEKCKARELMHPDSMVHFTELFDVLNFRSFYSGHRQQWSFSGHELLLHHRKYRLCDGVGS